MSTQTRVSNSMYCLLPTEVEGFGSLAELALDTRPARDYTVRVIPQRSGVAVPLESARILWQQ